MTIGVGVLVAVVLFSFFPQKTFALLPPDVIFALGTQMSQLWMFGGVMVVSAVASVAPLWRSLIGSRVVRFGIVGTCLAIFLAAYSDLLLSYFPTTNAVTTSVAGHHFFANRFIFVSTGGKQIAMDLSINRKEEKGGGYTHYYIVDLTDSGQAIHQQYEKYSVTGSAIIPTFFFTGFVRRPEPDHSAREAYTFSFSEGGHQYELHSSILEGDFISKIEPYYTEYQSVGTSTLVRDGETIPGNMYFERVYSDDYRPTIFFDGYSSIVGRSDQVVLWDEKGSFLLIDKTKVDTASSTAYTSHVWVMQKSDGAMRKAFDGTLAFDPSNASFSGAVPLLGISNLSLKITNSFDTDSTAGLAKGTISDAHGTRGIVGVVTYQEYGNRSE